MKPQPDAMALWHAWHEKLDNGARAQLRRVAEPHQLRDEAAFYRLVLPSGWEQPEHQHWLLRLVYCLSAGKEVLKHTKESVSLGQGLARTEKINEKRIYQLVRMEEPASLVQLRRLLIHAEPVVNWIRVAEQLRNWHQRFARQQLMEDFVITTHYLKTKEKSNNE